MNHDAPDAITIPGGGGPAPTLRILTLGSGRIVIVGPDGETEAKLGAKGVGLLAFVAIQPGMTVSRDALVELLWGGVAAEQGRASLRQELRRMRIALGPAFDAAIDATGGAVALRPEAVWCDAAALEAAAARRDADGLARLIDLHQGPFLGALAIPEQEFQDWAAMQASRYDSLALDGLLRQMLLDEAAGRLSRAEAAARALLRIDPLQDDVHAMLIRILLTRGRLSMAKAHLEACRALFLEELGEEPDDAVEAYRSGLARRRDGPPDIASAAPAAAGSALSPLPMRSREDPFSKRPLLALKPLSAANRADAALVHETTALLSNSSWFRVRSCDELFAAGLDCDDIPREIDYVATIADESGPAGPGAAYTIARRGDGAIVDRRVIGPVLDDEAAPRTALGRRIAAMIVPELLRIENAAEMARTSDPGDDYWRQLCRAAALYWRADRADLMASRALLERILKRHAEDGPAQALLALTHVTEGLNAWGRDPRDSFFLAREIALRAVRSAPKEAFPHYAFGAASSLMDGPEVGRPLQLRSLELTPCYAPAMGELARIFALDGELGEAESWAARAVLFSPNDPRMPAWRSLRALALYAQGRPAEAAQALRGVIDPRPAWSGVRQLAAAALVEAGDMAAAARILPPEMRPVTPAQIDAARIAHQFRDEARQAALLDALSRLARE